MTFENMPNKLMKTVLMAAVNDVQFKLRQQNCILGAFEKEQKLKYCHW